MKRVLAWLLAMSVCGPLLAQIPANPEGTTPIAGDELRARVAGKVFTWMAPNARGAARLQYDENGFAFINAYGGQNDSGKWRVEGSQLCIEWQRFPSSCGEVRVKGAGFIIKRSDGSWATLTPN
jgi:hypothetical protein